MSERKLIIAGGSGRVVPGKLLASGFEFRFPQMREALEYLAHSRSKP